MRLTSGPDGGVQVGDVPAGTAGLVHLPLAGGIVALDPSATHRLAAHVHDVDAAREAIAELFGPEAADALAATAQAGRRDGAAALEIPTQPLAASGRDLVRLALVRWLQVWSPLPVDPVVSVAESAVLASRLGNVLDVDFAASVEDDLLEVSDPLLQLSRLLRSASAASPDRALLGGLTADALSVLANTMPMDHPRYDEALRALQQRSDAMPAVGHPPADWPGAHEALLALAAPRTAIHAGTGQGGQRGETTIDWERVRPGLVSTEEGAVRWEVVGDRLEVQVPGASRLLTREAPVAELTLHVYAAALLDPPLASGPVVWEPSTGLFRGACTLPSTALSGDLLVEVHDSRVRTRPYEGTDALARAARRWSARALALTRWRNSTDGPLPVTYRALDAAMTAQQLYANALQRRPLEGRALWLGRARARNAQLVVLLLRLSGAEEDADELARVWQERDGVVGVDREAVDADGPGWKLTTTEQALLRVPRLLTLLG